MAKRLRSVPFTEQAVVRRKEQSDEVVEVAKVLKGLRETNQRHSYLFLFDNESGRSFESEMKL